MKIGSAWTRDKDGRSYISVAFDEAFLKLCPQLKGCNFILNYINRDDRSSEKSPGWSVNLSVKKPKNEDKDIKTEAVENNDIEENEEIPY